MRQPNQTANRYLGLLLVGTCLWMLVAALVSHAQLPFNLSDSTLLIEQRGFQASWRWWLLFLLSISVVGIVFLLGRRGSSQISNGRVFWGLLSLTAIWSLALAISGGAANAANAIQLILIAAAFMTLPATKAWLIFALIVMVQSTFLVSMLVAGEPHPHSHATPIGTSLVQDDLHYIGMSLTFLMAALLLSLTISYMQRSLQAQQREAQTMREAQLRQEQIIAMATASAQITHELATPLATIGMLYDELNEAKVRHPALTELEQPIAQVKSLLQYLRSVAVDIQSQQPQILTLSRLESQLQQQASLNFSTADIRWHLRSTDTDASIRVDVTFIPALLGLIRNALTASENVSDNAGCAITTEILADERWRLSISNPTTTLAREHLQALQGLGQAAVKSEKGLGFGFLLSHATLDRFHGELRIHLDETGQFHQIVSMPLIEMSNDAAASTQPR